MDEKKACGFPFFTFGKAVLLALVFLVFSATSLYAEQKPNHPINILYLNSYHYGYTWSDRIMAGFYDRIQESDLNIQIYAEYLDSRRFPSYYQNAGLHILQNKFEQKPFFDLVMAADNAALDYLLLHRDSLFPDIPIVFCGYNAMEEETFPYTGTKGLTGAFEVTKVRETVELALRLHPDAENLFFITSSYLSTYRSVFNQVTELIRSGEFAGRSVELFDSKTITALEEKLRTLPDSTLIFQFGRLVGDEINNHSVLGDAGRKLLRQNKYPVYTLWDIDLGSGLMGGVVLSAYTQGQEAAEEALHILNRDIPVTENVFRSAKAQTILDMNVVKQFGVDQDSLPEDAVLMNSFAELLDKYRFHIYNGIAILVVQFLTILYLLKLRRDKNRLIALLKKRENKLDQRVKERTRKLAQTKNLLLETEQIMSEHVIYCTLDDRAFVKTASDAFLEFYGFKRDEVENLDIRKVRIDDPDQVLEREVWNTIDTGVYWQGEMQGRTRNGEPIWIEATIHPVLDENGEFVEAKVIEKVITEQKSFEQLAVTDALTGLSNRHRIEEFLKEQDARYKRYISGDIYTCVCVCVQP